jgi:precorrin-2 dehydrogenase/sirohydrochlorin ferrochelatase
MSYPLLLNLASRRCLIVGAGVVGSRKARGLLDAGADDVLAVSLMFHPDFPEPVRRIVGKYDPSHLSGVSLVFASTDDPNVNAQVVRDARACGIWVNRADNDDTDTSDFTTPAVHRDGALTFLVSAGGSPSLASTIRDDLVEKLDPRHVRMADAMQTLRPIVLTEVPDPTLRRDIFKYLATEDALDLLETHGVDALLTRVRSKYSV